MPVQLSADEHTKLIKMVLSTSKVDSRFVEKGVLWSDKLRFKLLPFRWQGPGQVSTWKRLLPECSVSKVMFSGKEIMVWGWFFWFSLKPLVLNLCKLNIDAYCTITENNILPNLWQFYCCTYFPSKALTLRGPPWIGMLTMMLIECTALPRDNI